MIKDYKVGSYYKLIGDNNNIEIIKIIDVNKRRVLVEVIDGDYNWCKTPSFSHNCRFDRNSSPLPAYNTPLWRALNE